MKFKRVVAVILSLILAAASFSFMPVSAQTEVWSGGTDTEWTGLGTPGSPYLITNAEELAGFAAKVNSGVGYDGVYFELTADISLNVLSSYSEWGTNPPANVWTPVGNAPRYFYGNFSGGGHTVSGVYINSTGSNQGFFGSVNFGTISELAIESSYIKGASNVGAIAGSISYGVIKNCRVDADICATGSNAGGIAGYIDGSSVTGCCASGSVLAASYSGGIAGINGYGLISDCYSVCAVSDTSDYIGGICGKNNYGTIAQCVNFGTVNGIGDNVGEIVGSNNNSILNCYYTEGSSTNITNLLGISLSAEQAASVSSYEGFDFNYKWFLDTDYAYRDGYTDPHPMLQPLADFSSLGSPAIWDGASDTEWSGSGSENEPYLISSAAELAGLAEVVNSGFSYEGKCFKLISDITLNSESDIPYISNNSVKWIPIGYSHTKPFKGTFDGDGHFICGIYTDTPCGIQGLFGRLDGNVKNTVIRHAYISGGANLGTVAGYFTSGEIQNCTSGGTVSSISGVSGGIAGCVSNARISDSYSTSSVNSSGDYTGGISGASFSAALTECSFGGSVKTLTNNAGGISGAVDENSSLYGCFNTGSISALRYAGGICGNSTASNLENCFNTGKIDSSRYTGGICGYNTSGSKITGCYSIGDIGNFGTNYGPVAGYGISSDVSFCYYADVGETDSFGGTSFLEEAKFFSGEAAWLLNTSGGSSENSGIWSMSLPGSYSGDFVPVLASGLLKPVYKITVTGDASEILYSSPDGTVSSLQSGYTYTFNSAPFTSETTVSGDITITAAAEEEIIYVYADGVLTEISSALSDFAEGNISILTIPSGVDISDTEITVPAGGELVINIGAVYSPGTITGSTGAIISDSQSGIIYGWRSGTSGWVRRNPSLAISSAVCQYAAEGSSITSTAAISGNIVSEKIKTVGVIFIPKAALSESSGGLGDLDGDNDRTNADLTAYYLTNQYAATGSMSISVGTSSISYYSATLLTSNNNATIVCGWYVTYAVGDAANDTVYFASSASASNIKPSDFA